MGVNYSFISYANVLLLYSEVVLMGGAENGLSALEAVNQVMARANVPLLDNLTMDDLRTNEFSS